MSLLRKQMVEYIRRSFWDPIVLDMLAHSTGEENKLIQQKALVG